MDSIVNSVELLSYKLSDMIRQKTANIQHSLIYLNQCTHLFGDKCLKTVYVYYATL